MRASLSPVVGTVVALFALASSSSLVLVACGGETASLGSQGSEQGVGGTAGSSNSAGAAGAAGSNTAGQGGSSGECSTLAPVCKDGEYIANEPSPVCATCKACPMAPTPVGICPNGTKETRDPATNCVISVTCNDECPAITPPHPDFCKGGKKTGQKDAQGCDLQPTCLCPPEQACGPGTKAQPRPNGECGADCVPSSCPEIVEPSPAQCPSGGFLATYAADGCINGFECITCPVLGDPNFCPNGIVVVALKDGKCATSADAISCVPCAASEPPVVNWCNDGAKIVKKDGKCLDSAECQCPVQSNCPGTFDILPVPGSACNAFICNPSGCGEPTPPTETCTGNFEWQMDAKGCATTAVCKPFAATP